MSRKHIWNCLLVSDFFYLTRRRSIQQSYISQAQQQQQQLSVAPKQVIPSVTNNTRFAPESMPILKTIL